MRHRNFSINFLSQLDRPDTLDMFVSGADVYCDANHLILNVFFKVARDTHIHGIHLLINEK